MNKLSIEDILSGALVGKPELIEVDIVVSGEPRTFEMNANTEGREGLASILADCIVTETGERVFTEEQVRLKFNKHLIDAIWQKILEKNFLGKSSTQKKSSTNLSSGQNSSKTVSRGKRSAKQKRNSVTENSSSGNNIDNGEVAST